ncbi:unnamed protein product [Gordionus sp. m RMFG-2023]|uniref:GMP synthase [glutamine-hydrolyzing]-like n=1 Tax=Gordionus sp. m RMFG-2023 TaxID=3053472 RepID=UPI0030DFAD20
MVHDKIAILDAGAQYGKLIDRALRELCVESIIMPMDTPLSVLLSDVKTSGNPFKAIIISGGPGSVYDTYSAHCHPSIFNSFVSPSSNESTIPILGICYGFQLINHVFDGVIQPAASREDGVLPVKLDTHSLLYKGINADQMVLLTHGDSLIELGKGLKSNALSGPLVVGLEHEKHKIYGVQFHVEVDLTPCGKDILRNFVFNIANCKPNFTLPNRELACLEEIKSKVKNGHVLLLLSGGVDSCTCLALLKKCLRPEQIIALHIDNGFLRHQESMLIEKNLSKTLGLPIKVVNASNRFLQYALPYTDFFDMTYPGVMNCCLSKFINNSNLNPNHPNSNFNSNSSVSIKNRNSISIIDDAFDTDSTTFDPAINCCCCCACCDKETNTKMVCRTFNMIGRLNPKGGDNHNNSPPPSSENGLDGANIEIKHCECCCAHKSPKMVDVCRCCAINMTALKNPDNKSLNPPSRAVEEALVKMGMGPHCFKNYDGNIMLKPLCKVVNPEIKRRIIGDIFVQVADDIISEMKLDVNNVYFCQGTLRPDLIESASHLVSSKASVIKTHHNDTKLMRMLRAQGKVIEPLKDFHKDEVRSLARDLKLPQEIVERHPFPGPGLAIRIICAMEPFIDKTFTETNFVLKLLVQVLPEEYPKICHSNTIVQKLRDTLTSNDQATLVAILKNDKNVKYSAILLPVKSVGVQGDKRSYSYVCALSCSDDSNASSDAAFIPTDSKCLNWDHLFSLAQIIPKVCHNINRVVYAFGPECKLPVTEIVPTLVTPKTLGTLRLADYVAHECLHHCAPGPNREQIKKIGQMPVVMLPLQLDPTPPVSGDDPVLRCIVLRPFVSADFMTGVAARPGVHLPFQILDEMVDKITNTVEGVSRVLYDLTAKPPGTTEWE